MMIQSPILIIGSPRSGTTLLYNILSGIPTLWSIGYESKEIIEHFHHPRMKNWISGTLDANDLTPASRDYILKEFVLNAASGSFWCNVNRFRSRLRSNSLWRNIKQRGQTTGVGSATGGTLPQLGLNTIRKGVRLRNRFRGERNLPIRLLEKTPENCLRLPFLLALFPDARIIYLVRDGRANVNSLMEGWQQPYLFPGYHVPKRIRIPGDVRGRWAFTLIPGWQDLVTSPLEEVCAWQWIRCNEAVLAHQTTVKDEMPYLTIRHEDLVTQPGIVLPRIADFLQIDFDKDLSRFVPNLPQINVLSEPGHEKWRQQNLQAITRILPLIDPMMQKLGYTSNCS